MNLCPHILRQGVRGLKSLQAPRCSRALLIALVFLGLSGHAVPGESPGPDPASGRHVLVISVDGLGASWYMAPPPNLRIPNLLRLKNEGSFAEGVEGVYPSVTYPSHTTIVTGSPPAQHGVYSNLSSRQAGKNPEDWFWFSSSLKVPTLWDEARRARLLSAAVSWPVTVGAAIDWNVPEIWDPEKDEELDFEYISRYARPGLVEEILKAVGPFPPGTDKDTIRTRIASYIIKRYKPNLLLVHLADLDHDEHEHGPKSAEAAATLGRIDAKIGELLAATTEAGLDRTTDVFIVSDHGFLPVDRVIRPNLLLVKAGLLIADDKGYITGGKLATVANGGSFFIYWPEGHDLRSEVDNALKPLRDQGVVWAVFNPQALRELGAEPALQMALEAPEGMSFGSVARGELVKRMETPGGSHGYLPFRPGLEAAFIAWGPRIKSGVNLHRIRMTAIGPTILKSMGIDNAQFGAERPLEDIFK